MCLQASGEPGVFYLCFLLITPSPFPKEDFKNNRWGLEGTPPPVKQVALQWTSLQCSHVLRALVLIPSWQVHSPVVSSVAQHSDCTD